MDYMDWSIIDSRYLLLSQTIIKAKNGLTNLCTEYCVYPS